MSSRKRKHRSSYENSDSFSFRRRDGTSTELERSAWDEEREELEYDPTLRVVAHEADIVRGPRATYSADVLEVEAGGRVGEGLIRLGWDAEGEDAIWVDRYDARLLLDGPPNFSSTNDLVSSRPSSPGGWTDLPSDAEDTFFLSPEETEDYVRTKRRRELEQLRKERMRAIAEDEGREAAAGEQWGGSDEEPDEAQTALMHRTASHLLGTASGAQLEMRILANHGADPRFAFLRGRWPRAWARIKAHARSEKEGKTKKESASLGGLMGYADSEEESGRESDTKDDAHRENEVDSAGSKADEEAAKEAQRVRAREWAAQRRAAKAVDDDTGA